MEQWITDARHSIRRLIRRPRYAMLAILTLALGIGGSAAVFGIARAILFDPLPYTAPESIALFWAPFDWTQQEFAYIRGHVPGVTQVAQYTYADATLEAGDAPAQLIPGIAASSELFDVLGARPMLGRAFESKDDVRGAEAVVVISYGLWQQLGGSSSVIGQRIVLGGAPTTVVGVMPRGFFFPTPAVRAWVPRQLDPAEQVGNFALVGRLAPGRQMDQMAPLLAQLTATLKQRFTYHAQWDKTRDPWVKSARESFAGPLRPTLVAVAAAMAMILLIACVNVASLMLGQVEGRLAELAVRSALGATRGRLVRQLVTEAIVLGGAASIVGAVFAAAGFHWLVAAMPLGAWAETADLDWRVFGAAIAIAMTAALTISLAPTMSLWRGRLRASLGAARTRGVAGRGVRLESVLVVAEVAIAVLMAAGAGLLARSVQKLYAIDPGIQTHGVGVVDVVMPSDLTNDQRKVALRDLVAAVGAVPGVKTAAVTQKLPLRGSGWSSGITIDGIPSQQVTTTFVRAVSADYGQTMGIALVRGRTMTDADMTITTADTAAGVVVINESLAKKYFGDQDPVGHHVTGGFGPRPLRVIGVVRDAREANLTDAPAPVRYLPYSLMPFTADGQAIVFRVAGTQDPVALLNAVRAAIRRSGPRVAIQEVTTMDEVLAHAVGPARQLLALVTLLTTIALLLGAIGIYGVMSHFVARRQRDWGIRIALGLSPARVLAEVVGSGTTLVAIGIGIGLAAFALLARFLTSLIYGVGTSDPVAITSAIAGLLIVGIMGALLPALRASRTDPAIILREQ